MHTHIMPSFGGRAKKVPPCRLYKIRLELIELHKNMCSMVLIICVCVAVVVFSILFPSLDTINITERLDQETVFRLFSNLAVI